MEFIEDDRPRFLFNSRANPPSSSTSDQRTFQQPNKPLLFITTTLSALLIALSFLYLQSEPHKSLLLWLSLSLLVGPFAPSQLTGGDVRVGRGRIVEFPDQDPQVEEDAVNKRSSSQKRSKPAVIDDYRSTPTPIAETDDDRAAKVGGNGAVVGGKNDLVIRGKVEEKEWSEDEIEVLRKQLAKHPPGKPRRWEIIAEVFNGNHGVESVIKKAKELADKKSSDKDSYAQFLKNRKHLDRRIDESAQDLRGVDNGVEAGKEVDWSSGEDIALLNAMKAFRKDVSMRWEKIAAAVPGKTKADCIRRVSELKKDFRSGKAAKEG